MVVWSHAHTLSLIAKSISSFHSSVHLSLILSLPPNKVKVKLWLAWIYVQSSGYSDQNTEYSVHFSGLLKLSNQIPGCTFKCPSWPRSPSIHLHEWLYFADMHILSFLDEWNPYELLWIRRPYPVDYILTYVLFSFGWMFCVEKLWAINPSCTSPPLPSYHP